MSAGRAALERAWAHDSGGRESEAIPEYRAAIEAGLDDEELLSALLGLGSSLRNVGALGESLSVLSDAVGRFPDHAGLRVFLALTRWTGGERAEGARELVEALFQANAPGMARYERSIRAYVAELD